MVFESVVVDVLNRFLGSYVENLDASQLKIGIFGGDVDLSDLIIKPSALDDLNVPFRVTYGFIKKLRLKIPWKDLYGSPVVATIDGVIAVVVPSSGTKYDEAKEFRAIQESKQKALAKNEELKAKERDFKNPTKTVKEDSLVEKITAQVIKNVQVQISNIHVRYEDTFTNAARPFSFGVTLSKLNFDTTDENWKPMMVDRNQHIFHKLVMLDSFSFYWNSKVRLISHLSPREIMTELVNTIAAENFKPPGIGYMIGPITSTARLKFNQKPELNEYRMPSLTVDLTIEDISIGMSKCQYHDIMALIDSINRMWLADRFRKYHPSVRVNKNARQWWKFAYTAILEEQIRPHRRQWNKEFLLSNIRKIKDYRQEYKNKLLKQKETETLKKLEEELDLFNIILARRQAEVEVEKLPKPEAKKGWFGSWWGGKSKEEGAGSEIVTSFQKEMTSEEKAKLYAAIDYNENQVPVEYPLYFVDKEVKFLLKTLSISILDDTTRQKEVVMQATLKEVSSSVEMRPKGDALKVAAKLEGFNIESFPTSDSKRRTLLTSDKNAGAEKATKHLLDITYETNPLEGGCDQRIRVFAEPVEMFYDVRSFEAVVDVFKPPDSVSIDNIQNTAVSSIRNLRVMSATGLQHAIDNKPSLDIHVAVKPSYILIYEGGKIDDTKNVLVFSMGQLFIRSKPRNKDAPTVKELVQAGKSEKDVLKALFNEAYDKMELHLSAAELLIVPSCELWRDCLKRSLRESTHILQPTDLYINIDICFLPDEKRIPKVKGSGKLPCLEIDLSDEKLTNLLKIVQSLSGEPQPSGTQGKLKEMGQSTVIEDLSSGTLSPQPVTQVVRDKDAQNVAIAPRDREDFKKNQAEFFDAVLVDLGFEVIKFLVKVNQVKREGPQTVQTPLLVFATNELRMALIMRPADLNCEITLKNTSLTHLAYRLPESDKSLPILESSVDPGTGFMLKITYTQAEPKHPDFRTRFNNTLSSVKCTVGEMTFALHQEAMVSLMGFASSLTESIGQGAKTPAPNQNQSVSDKSHLAVSGGTPTSLAPIQTTLAPPKQPLQGRLSATSKKPPVIQFSAIAQLAALKIILCRNDRFIANMDITGVEARFEETRRSTIIHLVLKYITMVDPNRGARHPQIVSITGDEVLNLKISQYEESGVEGYTNMEKVDMSLEATIGRMHFVFLFKFYLDIMLFLDSFQAAKDKVADATAAAAAAAKGVAELAYEKAYKAALKVTIKAPVIYLPESSESQSCLVMDFGVLSIGNSFQPGPTVPAKSVPVLYETTKISIDNLLTYRCQLKPLSRETIDKSKFSMMEPVSFGLEVQRNLTAAAHKELPELKMKGTITSVNLKIGEDDYSSLMKTLSGNLTETPPGYQKSTVATIEQVQAAEKHSGNAVNSNEQVITVEQHTKPETNVEKLTRMEIFFTLQEIKLQLYTRRTLEKCEELCELNIAGFKLCGNFNHDDSFWVSMVLGNLLLDDRRSSRKEGIRRLISKADASDKMIDIIYQAESTGAFHAKVEVSKMRFVYSASLNMALLDLLNQANVKAENELERGGLGNKVNQAAALQPNPAAQAPVTKTKIVPFKLIVQISQPDVLLVADLENPSSACIIFKSSVNIRVDQIEDRMTTRMVLQDIEMFVSSLDSTGHRSEILRRFDIIVEMNTNTRTKMENAKMEITPIEIHMTPSAVEIVSASLSALSVAPTKANDDEVPEFFDPAKLWRPQHLETLTLWYTERIVRRLKPIVEPAQEAIENKADGLPIMSQQASFNMNRVLITIEQGSGAQTMPMLLVNSSLKGDARNWGSKLEIDGILQCGVSYYNERCAVWEPLIESVESLSGDRKQWEVEMEVRAAPADIVTDGEQVPTCQLPAQLKVLMKCKENLEVTVTKTALQVLLSLGEEFSQALAKKADMVDSRKVDAPYCIKNSLGMPLTLNIEESNFTFITTEEDSAVLQSGEKLHLDFRNRAESLGMITDVPLENLNEAKEDKLFFNVRMNFDNTAIDRKLNVNHTAKRVFRIPFRSYPGDDWSFVVDVSSHYGSRLVTLYSIVEVHNDFSVPIDIYYWRGEDLEQCASVAPKSLSHIPLVALYTHKNELLFKPAGDRYQMAECPLTWKSKVGENRMIACKATNPSKSSLFMNVVSATEQLPYDDSPDDMCTKYTLRLSPTVIVNNLLPMAIDINLKDSNVHFDLESGQEIELWNARASHSVINIRMEYSGMHWHCAKRIEENIEPLSAITFTDTSKETKTLDLALHSENKEGCHIISIHCPFWLLNKTKADLYYKATEETICHAKDYQEPVLFTFGAKHMFTPKKRMCLRIFDSDWSSKTPVDAVGQSGTIMAKSTQSDRIYPLSINVALSSTALTRVVTFTPFYMVTNNSKFGAIEVQEFCEKPGFSSEWIRIEKGQCEPLWPKRVANVEYIARYVGTQETTVPFSIKESSLVLLQMKNKFAGLYMCCQVTDSASVVSFSEYEQGLSAVLLVNDTDVNVFVRQEYKNSSCQCVQSGHAVHYTWEDPRQNRQLLSWVTEADICKVGPLKDGDGKIELPNNECIYWTSFLDGKQRVLYFNKDPEHYSEVKRVGSQERVQTDFELEFHGMGLSLVDDEPKRREILYLSIVGSGTHWESKASSKTKYKTLAPEFSQQIEFEFQRFLKIAKTVGEENVDTPFVIGNSRFDFRNMRTIGTDSKTLRRNCRPGLWLQLKQTENQRQFHFKIHRIQIDNQIRDCQFPVILSPIVYKKNVGEAKLVKPIIELAGMTRQFQGSSLRQIKYCKLLIQEFAIRLDLCFINSMLSFATLSAKKTTYKDLMTRDLAAVKLDLKQIASVHAMQGQRDYIDYMHLSPMKIHLSFSLYSGGSAPPPPEGAFGGVKLLLQSFGVTLTDVQGAVLRLDFFQRENDFSTMNQLTTDVISHYTKACIKQLYMVILGLDLIGNPVGLVMGIGTGVGDFFYEPLQGAILGPEEFVAGLAQGVKSLIGHTVGGAADAVGKITGALGKGVAALTMDEQYQRKRRLEKNKRPQDVTEGIAQSGKDLVMGFYDGVTGVVTKPLEGAKEEGVTGFMKGMGKGLIGVVARPAAGVVDFTSGALASVKRVTELEDVALPVRPPRFIRDNGIVQPYNRMEAEGHQLLQEVENGKYAETDSYVTHLSVCSDGRNFVILTSNRILFVEKGDIFGHWNCEWEYQWDQIKPPVICAEGVKVLLKEPKKKGLFQSKENGKIINISDSSIAEWLKSQIDRVMRKNA